MNALCEAVKTYGPLAGRILLALIFVISGYNKLVGFDGTVGYIASKGLPLPQLAAAAAIAIDVDRLDQTLPRLPRDRDIILYCT